MSTADPTADATASVPTSSPGVMRTTVPSSPSRARSATFSGANSWGFLNGTIAADPRAEVVAFHRELGFVIRLFDALGWREDDDDRDQFPVDLPAVVLVDMLERIRTSCSNMIKVDEGEDIVRDRQRVAACDAILARIEATR